MRRPSIYLVLFMCAVALTLTGAAQPAANAPPVTQNDKQEGEPTGWVALTDVSIDATKSVVSARLRNLSSKPIKVNPAGAAMLLHSIRVVSSAATYRFAAPPTRFTGNRYDQVLKLPYIRIAPGESALITNAWHEVGLLLVDAERPDKENAPAKGSYYFYSTMPNLLVLVLDQPMAEARYPLLTGGKVGVVN